MRVLYLCPDLGIPVLGRKGASVHVRGLAEGFRRAGDDVVVVSALLSKSPWEAPAPLAVPVKHLPLAPATADSILAVKTFLETIGAADSPLAGELRRILWNEQAAVELKRQFDKHRPDFVYERSSLYGTVGVRLGRELKVPLLFEVNAPIADEQTAYRGSRLGELARDTERWALSRADAVVCVSEPLRDHVVGLGVAPDRVHVVPNGFDPALFHPEPPDPGVRERWALGERPVVGFAGGLRPWHAIRLLPGLLEALAGSYPDVLLVVVGDGPLRGELERELNKRGLADNAVLTGSVPHEEVAGLIRQFDIALAPYEPLEHAFYFSPLKLFEYMACGKPVVAARIGQLAAVVQDGATGLTYEPGDADGLARACERLLADAALRHRLGAAAAAKAHGEYTWDHSARRVRDAAGAAMTARQQAADEDRVAPHRTAP